MAADNAGRKKRMSKDRIFNINGLRIQTNLTLSTLDYPEGNFEVLEEKEGVDNPKTKQSNSNSQWQQFEG